MSTSLGSGSFSHQTVEIKRKLSRYSNPSGTERGGNEYRTRERTLGERIGYEISGAPRSIQENGVLLTFPTCGAHGARETQSLIGAQPPPATSPVLSGSISLRSDREGDEKRERNSFHNSVTKSFLSLLISRSSAVDRVWLVGQHWARAVTSDFPQESPWCREDPFGTRVTSRRRVTVNSLYLPPVCCSQTFFFFTKFLRCFDCLFRSGGIPGLSTTWQENQKLFSEPFSKVARTSQKDEDRLSSLAVWLPPKRRSRET